MVFSLRRTFSCPVQLALEVLGGKWKTVILAHLKGGGDAVRLVRVAKAGGELEPLGVGTGCGDASAMDATHVYWPDSFGHRLLRTAKP